MPRLWIAHLGMATLVAACAAGSSADDVAPGPRVDPEKLDASPDTGGETNRSDARAEDATGDAEPQDSAARPDAPVALACGKTFDFESGDGAFTHAPLDSASGATFDAWRHGVATSGARCH